MKTLCKGQKIQKHPEKKKTKQNKTKTKEDQTGFLT
jgi:hypothetical protein